jgi:GDP-L-fucose synthase
MVGGAIWNALKKKGYENLVGKTSKELDLRDQQAVREFFNTEKPDVVIDAAARVGGIMANSTYPFTFLMENMQIQNNLIDTALQQDVPNLSSSEVLASIQKWLHSPCTKIAY